MKSIVLVLSIFCFGGITVSGQRLEVTKGEPIIDREFIKTYKTYPNANDIFVNSRAQKGYTIYNFVDGKLMVGIWNEYISLSQVKGVTGFGQPGTSVEVGIELFASLEGKNFVFFTNEIPKSDEVTLYVTQLDDEMNPLGSPVILERYKDLKKFGRTIAIVPSDDKKHFLIARVYKRKNTNDPQKAECKVIGADFSEVWKKEFPFENGKRDVILRSVRLDSNGNMILIAELATNDPILNPENQEFNDVVYTYFHKTGNFKKLEPGLKEGENFGTRIEVKGNVIFVAGLNRQRKDVRYFIHKLNAEAETLDMVSSNLMPEKFFKTAQWKINEVGFWRIADIIPLDNGLWVLSVESNISRGDGRYLSFDTFLMAFTETGEHKWSYVIRKLQNFKSHQLVGVRYIPAGKKIFAVYNDVTINLKRGLDEKAFITDPAYPFVIVVQEIDENGTGKRYALSDDKELEENKVQITSLRKVDDAMYYATVETTNKKGDMTRNIAIRVK